MSSKKNEPKESAAKVEEVSVPKKAPGPLRKAFTIERQDGAWTTVTVHYQDDTIVKVDRTVPDLKAQAINQFKINAFKYWSSDDVA